MRILVVSQYYPPEITAAAMRVGAFARGLAARGHEVEVICEVPSHPQGVIQPGYRRRAVTRDREDGLTVSRVWVYASPSKRAMPRITNYASFAAAAAVAGSARRRPDVVLCSSPPLPVGAAAAAVARRFRVPWALDVRDLWPDIAVVLDQLPEGLPLELARRLERRLYRGAARITTVTEPFRRHIEAHGGGGKTSVIYNGTTRTYLEAAEQDPDRAGLALDPDDFILTYAGNLGIAQGLESAVEAFGMLGEGYRLLLLGDGPRRPALEELAGRVAPGRVEFRDLVPPAEAARIMRASDAVLVSLAARPELQAYLPSKVFDACAVGRPVIVATGGEAERLVSAADAALCVPPEDSAALLVAVTRLRMNSDLAADLAGRGSAFAADHLRDRSVAELERVLFEAAGRRKDPPGP